MAIIVYNNTEDNGEFPYLEIEKLAKDFISKNKRYLPLFENDYESMFNDLFCEGVHKYKKFDLEHFRLSTFLFSIFNTYCLALHRFQIATKRKANFDTLNIDDYCNLQSNENVETECEIRSILKMCPKIIIQYYIEGYKQYELAQIYNTTKTNVCSILKKELEKIKRILN
ncbi:MAG: hypothetical protein RR054_04455 [Clostridia bacterium]